MSLLAKVLETKRQEIAALKKSHDRPTRRPHKTIDVARILRRKEGEALRLIAEIKFKSPSAGDLSHVLSVTDRANAYRAAGASMVSVLCDETYFGGSYMDLEEASAALDGTPVLAKEYVLDELQIERAASCGADAVLIIVRIVDDETLKRLISSCGHENLTAVVEVFNEAELQRAIAAKANVIGVNARDLDTLAMDGARAAAVLAKIPSELVAIHLSGVKTEADVRDVAKGRADAALLGEALMRADDPRPLLKSLVSAAKSH